MLYFYQCSDAQNNPPLQNAAPQEEHPQNPPQRRRRQVNPENVPAQQVVPPQAPPMPQGLQIIIPNPQPGVVTVAIPVDQARGKKIKNLCLILLLKY